MCVNFHAGMLVNDQIFDILNKFEFLIQATKRNSS